MDDGTNNEVKKPKGYGQKDFWKVMSIKTNKHDITTVTESQHVPYYGCIQKITTLQGGKVVSVVAIPIPGVKLRQISSPEELADGIDKGYAYVGEGIH